MDVVIATGATITTGWGRGVNSWERNQSLRWNIVFSPRSKCAPIFDFFIRAPPYPGWKIDPITVSMNGWICEEGMNEISRQMFEEEAVLEMYRRQALRRTIINMRESENKD
jgi:hypothetical protein